MNYELVVVGTSLGGLETLKILIGKLKEFFPLPIIIVIHRHKESDNTLSKILQRFTSLSISDAEDKEKILPGHIYLGPTDYHLLVEKGYVSLSIDPPVLYARPSINVLFESAAEAYSEKLIGIILTGNSNDGANGISTVKKYGGFTIAQDPQSAEADLMPLSAIKTNNIDKILSLEEIATFLNNISIEKKD